MRYIVTYFVQFMSFIYNLSGTLSFHCNKQF